MVIQEINVDPSEIIIIYKNEKTYRIVIKNKMAEITLIIPAEHVLEVNENAG